MIRLLAALLVLAGFSATADAQSRFIVPQAGGRWVAIHSPSVWLPVWVDPAFKTVRTHEGRPTSEAIDELLLTVGTHTDVGFFEAHPRAYELAMWQFNYRDPNTVCSLSRTWRTYADPNLCSVYFAVEPKGQALFLGTLSKPSQGARPLPRDVQIRTAGHAWCTLSLKFAPEQSVNAPLCTMSSPHMTGAIEPLTYENGRIVAVGGWGLSEVARWRAIAKRYGAKREGGWIVGAK
jgi:hypothetical protein